jgi:hypothetical protein
MPSKLPDNLKSLVIQDWLKNSYTNATFHNSKTNGAE